MEYDIRHKNATRKYSYFTFYFTFFAIPNVLNIDLLNKNSVHGFIVWVCAFGFYWKSFSHLNLDLYFVPVLRIFLTFIYVSVRGNNKVCQYYYSSAHCSHSPPSHPWKKNKNGSVRRKKQLLNVPPLMCVVHVRSKLLHVGLVPTMCHMQR